MQNTNHLPEILGTFIPPTYRRPKKGESRGFIYVMQNADKFKIGYTRDLKTRTSSVQVNSATPVSLLLTYEVPNMLGEEKILKIHFRNRCMRGEWFLLSENDLNFIRGRKAQYEKRIA